MRRGKTMNRGEMREKEMTGGGKKDKNAEGKKKEG